MASFNKINLFTQDMARGLHNFQSGGATYKFELSNTATVATNHLYSDISANEVANGGGYTTGGASSAMSDSSSSGTEKVLATNITWTGSGSGFGPFRYVTGYRSDDANKELVCWYDYGSAISLGVGDTFTVSFDGTNGFFTNA